MSENNQDNLPIDPVISAALRARQVPASDSCIDPETLAAWFEGGLDAAQVAAVDSHLADCLRCQSILAAFAESSDAAAATVAHVAAQGTTTVGTVIPFAKPSRMRWIAPVAAGLAAAGIFFWMIQPPSDSTPPVDTQLAQQAPTPQPLPTPTVVAAPEQSAVSGTRLILAPPQRQEAAPLPPPSPLPMPGGALPTTSQANSNVTLGAPPQMAQGKPAAGTVAPPPAAVAAPPPNPTIAVDSALARADRNTMKFEQTAKKFPIEFGPPTTAGGRGGAGGGGAGGGGRAGGVAALRTTPSVPATIRWRILETGRVERTINAGETWTAVTLEPQVFITAGAAPAPAACWLVGRDGAVFRSIDGATFGRIVFPHAIDLESVTAQSADRATVSTRDGRTFTTTDGGHTWSSD